MTNGQRLREWRKHKPMTQVALAAKLGVTPSALCHIERGNNGPGLELATLIQLTTKGKVKATEW